MYLYSYVYKATVRSRKVEAATAVNTMRAQAYHLRGLSTGPTIPTYRRKIPYHLTLRRDLLYLTGFIRSHSGSMSVQQALKPHRGISSEIKWGSQPEGTSQLCNRWYSRDGLDSLQSL